MGFFHRKDKEGTGKVPDKESTTTRPGGGPKPKAGTDVPTESFGSPAAAGFAKPADDSPLEYTIEIRDLPEKEGVEILVAVVNQGEGPVRITGGKIGYSVDFKSKGIHDLSFPDADRDGHLTLDQFEIGRAHFFFRKYTDYRKIDTKVFLEYEAVDGLRREQISQRIVTRGYRKDCP